MPYAIFDTPQFYHDTFLLAYLLIINTTPYVYHGPNLYYIFICVHSCSKPLYKRTDLFTHIHLLYSLPPPLDTVDFTMFSLNSAFFVFGAFSLTKVDAQTPQTKNVTTNFELGTVICGILIFVAGAVTMAMAFKKGNGEPSNTSTATNKLPHGEVISH